MRYSARQTTATALALAAALGRWHGELLPEDAYEPWAQRHANRIREWRTTLVMKLVEDDLVKRDPQAAVALLDTGRHRQSAARTGTPGDDACARRLRVARPRRWCCSNGCARCCSRSSPPSRKPQTRQLYRDLLARRRPERAAHPRATNLPGAGGRAGGPRPRTRGDRSNTRRRAVAHPDRSGWCRQDDARGRARSPAPRALSRRCRSGRAGRAGRRRADRRGDGRRATAATALSIRLRSTRWWRSCVVGSCSSCSTTAST